MHHPTDRITHTTAFVTPVVGHWRFNVTDLYFISASVSVQVSAGRENQDNRKHLHGSYRITARDGEQKCEFK